MDLALQQERIAQLQEGSFLIDTNLNENDLNKLLMERLQNLLEANPLTKALVLSGSDFATHKLEALLYQADFFRRLDCRDRYEVRNLTSFCWNFLYIYFEEAELPSDVGLCAYEQDRLMMLRDAIISDEQLAEYFIQNPNQETLLKDGNSQKVIRTTFPHIYSFLYGNFRINKPSQPIAFAISC